MSDIRKDVAENLRKRGFPNAAKYVEMFGIENLCPSFRKVDEKAEKFYKNCVEEGHPWDWYFEFPEDAVF